MNAVEIEQAVSALFEQPFVAEQFPYQFLEAFGNKDTTLRRLRAGATNKSDLGGVLQTNYIHIAVAAPGEVSKALAALKASPATAKYKAQFVLATDGVIVEAENLQSDDAPVVCGYSDFPNHFGYFLSLAGISTVKQIRDSSFDIRATSRLNRLYVELLKDNPEWGTAARRHDMNHFMARLIFCFYAEDTGIFQSNGLFTTTVAQMSAKDASNTHEVIGEIFRAMNVKLAERETAGIPRWADAFPYVNGGLFAGNSEVPRFSKIARSYLLHIGSLPWTKINPDIFGSMIQAVADDDERGALGMHYTSVPNILKVLDPLFLDDLRAQLEEAGDNARKLLNLRNRMKRIRVFDPACGSGNFLVIAYKKMREIEAEINHRRSDGKRPSEIPLTNFRGIELRDFPAEIARLALVIAEFQCDEEFRGKQLALNEFLPLTSENWITCGNALRLDWLSICPPTGTGVKLHSDDLFGTPLDQAEIDFDNDGRETYLCSNPPFHGDKKQSLQEKSDMALVFRHVSDRWRSLDYVCAFLFKAAKFLAVNDRAGAALVATNSISQGMQVAEFWPLILPNVRLAFARLSFKWSNLAARNAGVTVVVVGIQPIRPGRSSSRLYDGDTERSVERITPYLTAGETVYVSARSTPLSPVPTMLLGNFAKDGGFLFLTHEEIARLDPIAASFVRPAFGADEFINGDRRYCLWISDQDVKKARLSREIDQRLKSVAERRSQSTKKATAEWSARPHRFVEIRSPQYSSAVIVPRVSSESREHLPVGLLPEGAVITEAFGLYDAPLWTIAIISSKLHLAWIGTVCGRMKTDYRYSNTLGWNTFPMPALTDKNKADLIRCAEDILLIREAHFPATIAHLYGPKSMPDDLREAHDRNDEVLERIYIGRRFKNDTERLEKLFDLYTKMTTQRGKADEGARA